VISLIQLDPQVNRRLALSMPLNSGRDIIADPTLQTAHVQVPEQPMTFTKA
jgi:hypothetical protein